MHPPIAWGKSLVLSSIHYYMQRIIHQPSSHFPDTSLASIFRSFGPSQGRKNHGVYFPPNQLEMPLLALAASASTFRSTSSIFFSVVWVASLRYWSASFLYWSNFPSARASSARALSACWGGGLSLEFGERDAQGGWVAEGEVEG